MRLGRVTAVLTEHKKKWMGEMAELIVLAFDTEDGALEMRD